MFLLCEFIALLNLKVTLKSLEEYLTNEEPVPRNRSKKKPRRMRAKKFYGATEVKNYPKIDRLIIPRASEEPHRRSDIQNERFFLFYVMRILTTQSGQGEAYK